MAEKLSEKVRRVFHSQRYHEVFGEMAERIEALEEWREFSMPRGVVVVRPGEEHDHSQRLIGQLRAQRDVWERRCFEAEHKLSKALQAIQQEV